MRIGRQVRTAVSGMLAWVAALGVCAGQTTTRVSTNASGTQVTGSSLQPRVSADGRFVAFSSTAGTLVLDDGNGVTDVFVKDRQTGAVERASLTTAGAEGATGSLAPDISADGRYVTFVSAAPFTADDTNGVFDVFRRDRTTGQTIRVSVASNGTQGNGHAGGTPRISGNGRYVVFESLASNLVAGDTNQAIDVFLRDIEAGTTTRVNVATNGAQADGEANTPTISDDGARIAFVSAATTLDASADPMACDAALALTCTRVFVYTVATATTVRLPVSVSVTSLVGVSAQAFRMTEAAISGDGLSVTVFLYGQLQAEGGTFSVETFARHSFAPGAPAVTAVSTSAQPVQPVRLTSLAVDATGRTLAFCAEGGSPTTFRLQVFDQQSWSGAVVPPAGMPDCIGVDIAATGLVAAFASSGGTIVSGDTNTAFDAFVLDLDGDDDGMSASWEAAFRFSDVDPADAAADTDGDGVTNLQEYVAGTHPRGLFKYYLAEGARNAFFDTEIAVFKPATPAIESTNVVAQFLGQNGRRTTSPILNLSSSAAGGGLWYFSRDVLGLDAFPVPDQAFSTLVESEQPMAVERTMTWGGGMGTGYGSHAERAISGPAATWYFAEGATHGAFDLFYLLQNPSSVAATATITYLLPAPQAPIVRTYTLLPNSRRTIYVDEEPGLAATDVSAQIDADRPIFAERAMYMTANGQPFAGGTASAGITTPGTQWFIAEGATGAFFDLFILIGNSSPSAAAVSVSYLLPNGTTVEKTYQVPGQSRRTISVKSEDARLAATAVSATITSTNSVPIVVERAMWWPSPLWYEGTVTAATTTSAARWALAGAFVDRNPETETYLLVANPGTSVANVTFKVGMGGGLPNSQNPTFPACQVTVAVPSRGRYTAGLKGLCPAMAPANIPGAIRVAGTIESDGPPIVVERSTYWSAGGQFWAAGASTLLTPLP